MNIFYLDKDPEVAAEMMCDKHIVKMPLESAQMLCTAHRVADNASRLAGTLLYKLAHKNHPSSIWARESSDNYSWLYRHFIALSEQYAKRYGRRHLSDKKLAFALSHLPKGVPYGKFSEPPQCMPDQYKDRDTIRAYRTYYAQDKKEIAQWANGVARPDWWTSYVN